MKAREWMHVFTILAMILLTAGLLSCGATSNGDDDDDDSGDDDSDDSDDDSGDDTDDDSGDTTIYDIQQGNVAEGIVTLKDVVATSPLGYGQNAFFLEEPDAGEYSGIYVYVYDEVAAELDIYPGDVVDITAEYSEYDGLTELTLTSIDDITITGTGAVPDAELVDPADVATGGTQAEAYESVLIVVENVEVTTEADQYGEWVVESSLIVDDFFYAEGTGPEPAVGTFFSSITGPLGYSFEDFKIMPRGDEDLEGDDDTDDDTGDDTGDDDDDVTIYDIQQGDVTADTEVTLTDVIVTTPVSAGGQFFFVEEADAGQYSGICIYVIDPSKAPDVAPGDVVTLTGTYTEYSGQSEIELEDSSAVTVTSSASVPAPEVVDSADIATAGSLGEQYEGVLVKVEDVTVLDEDLDHGEWSVTDDLIIDDLFYGVTTTVGTDYDSITGCLAYSFSNFKIEPRTAADVVEADR